MAGAAGRGENYRSFAWHGVEEIRAVMASRLEGARTVGGSRRKGFEEIRAVGPGRHIGARTKEVWRVKGWKRSELEKIRAEVVEAS